MKHLILALLTFFVLSTANGYAQDDKTNPPFFGSIVERRVDKFAIEDKWYEDCVVKLVPIGDINYGKVRIIVRQADKPKRSSYYYYNKTFRNCYVYVEDRDTISVGFGNAMTYLIMLKAEDGEWIGKVSKYDLQL